MKHTRLQSHGPVLVLVNLPRPDDPDDEPLNLNDIPPDFLELNMLLVRAFLSEELWQPPEAVPDEELSTWPDDLNLQEKFEEHRDLFPHEKSPQDLLQTINMTRAMRFFHWKHPGFEYPPGVIDNLLNRGNGHG